ncbi:MAG: secretin N-terminal domain-containing protein [Betaproteobacteria bacterium]|nr:secretin N-terminal domain-containing protein [Betaproteobacteria bacterium]
MGRTQLPLTLACIALLSACGTAPVARDAGHLGASPEATRPAVVGTGVVPTPIRDVPLPPPPKPRVEELKYSVTVKDVPVQELMFAISRDTKVNIDIHPGIEGRVTLNAIDQTLKQILTRVSKQVDMRWEVDGPNIVVRPDQPYLKLYRIDYVNMQRDSTSSIGVQTQVVGPSDSGLAGGNTSSTGSGENSSRIKLENVSKNRFWENLEKNVKDLLRETDKLLPEGSKETITQSRSQGSSASTRPQQTSGSGRSNATSRVATTTGAGAAENAEESQSVSQVLNFREAASVIVNPETGTVAVRATSRQHEKVGEFIEQIGGAARRQVLIEATVVEVLLNDKYQAGVDWSALGLQNLGYSFRQSFTGANLQEAPFFSLQYRNPNAAAGGDISSTVKMLNSFGTSKVLSSPKIMTLNNQTAVMRVVENRVYFTIKAEPITTVNPTTGVTTQLFRFTSTPNVVPEGFVMNVTPQIGENDIINLNMRPSVTRITSFVNDPNPDLNRTGAIPNQIPQIQTREFETMLRVASGQTAVLGGLMQDSFAANRDGLPILARIPILGDAVSYRNDTGRKSELVVFLRATVIRDANVDTELSSFRRYLPDGQFFRDPSPSLDPVRGLQSPERPPSPEGKPAP